MFLQMALFHSFLWLSGIPLCICTASLSIHLSMDIVSMHAKLLQSRLTLWDQMNYSPPGSSVHEILQARILEWVAISFFQRIFLTKGLNPHLLCLLHLQVDSLPLASPRKPILGIYPDKTLIQKDTCTPVIITAWFTVARTWKQPKCPLTDEWIKKMWYICNGIWLSNKREWNNAICSHTDSPRNYHIKWSQEEKDKHHMISLICGI